MEQRVQCGLTAGLAIVGASVIAITPIAPTTTAASRVVDAAASLMANFSGMSQAELLALSGQRLAEQFAQVPFVPLAAAADLAGGDQARLYTVLRSVIDSPLYVADPVLEAAADTLPPSLGGGTDHITNTTLPTEGAIMQFRLNTLIGARDAADGFFADALGVPASTDANTANGLANGVTASVERTVEGAVLAPVGLVTIAQAMADGDAAELYTAIRQYIDAPLWAADPTITALEKALPESLGGATEFGDNQQPTDGGLKDFRDQQLWGATHEARVAVAKVLNVPLNAQDNPVTPLTTSTLSKTTTKSVGTQLPKLGTQNTKLNSQVKQAGQNVQKQVKNVQTNVNKALSKVSDAVKNVAKKPESSTSDD
jgi:hypothetical protein